MARLTRRHGKWALSLLPALLAVALIAGCGGDSKPPPPGTPSAAEFLIDQKVLDEQPKGSPEETLMNWWRSMQYNDFDGYLEQLSAPLRAERSQDKKAKGEIALVSGELVRAQPQVVNVEKAGNHATVFSRIAIRQPVGASRYTTSSTPQAFTLVREGGKWRIAEDFYVENRARIIEEALAAVKAG